MRPKVLRAFKGQRTCLKSRELGVSVSFLHHTGNSSPVVFGRVDILSAFDLSSVYRLADRSLDTAAFRERDVSLVMGNTQGGPSGRVS